MPKPKTNNRLVWTARCGEVGQLGTRYVLEGGKFVIGGSRGAAQRRRVFHAAVLEQRVGDLIWFHDDDDMQNRISVYTTWVRWGRVTQGEWIAYAREVKDK